ncbi:MAG: hypothetical protein AAF288_07255 [Planctomycetota bacterium]
MIQGVGGTSASAGLYAAGPVRRPSAGVAAVSELKQVRAADAPAGLIASQALRAALTAIEAEQRTVARAGMAANVADGTLGEVSGLMRDAHAADVALANTAGMSRAEQQAIAAQRTDAVRTADRLVRQAEFGGTRLFDGSASFRAGDARLDLPAIDATTASAESIATTRGEVGAFQQSVASRGRVLDTAARNTVAADASLRNRAGSIPGYPDPSQGAIDPAAAERARLGQRAQLIDLIA